VAKLDIDETFECPIDGCSMQVESHRYMCNEHWRMVPPELSLKLHRLRDRGRGVSQKEYLRAFRECVTAVESIESADA
jgi:hypothetical protein